MWGFLLPSHLDDVKSTENYAKARTKMTYCMRNPFWGSFYTRESTCSFQALIPIFRFQDNMYILSWVTRMTASFSPPQLVSNSRTGRDHSLLASIHFRNPNDWLISPLSSGCCVTLLRTGWELLRSLKHPARTVYILSRWERRGIVI